LSFIGIETGFEQALKKLLQIRLPSCRAVPRTAKYPLPGASTDPAREDQPRILNQHRPFERSAAFLLSEMKSYSVIRKFRSESKSHCEERPLMAQTGRSGIWNFPLCQPPEQGVSEKSRFLSGARAVRIRKIDPAPIWSWSSASVGHRWHHRTLQKEPPVPVLMSR
jgi:hypothetical protein